jgi:hypothetical protein
MNDAQAYRTHLMPNAPVLTSWCTMESFYVMYSVEFQSAVTVTALAHLNFGVAYMPALPRRILMRPDAWSRMASHTKEVSNVRYFIESRGRNRRCVTRPSLRARFSLYVSRCVAVDALPALESAFLTDCPCLFR